MGTNIPVEFTDKETEILKQALRALQNAIASDTNGEAFVCQPNFRFDIHLLSKERDTFEAKHVLQTLILKLEITRNLFDE